MIPIVAVVGTSGCGKTTLVCSLVEELTARGYRLATLKHHPGDFDIDREGKDSYRHREAGSRQAMIASESRLGIVRQLDRELTPAEIAATLPDDIDLLLVEGYKRAALPKLEVWRQGQPDERLVCSGDPNWIALVTDYPHDVEVPVFDLNMPHQVADFLEREFLLTR